MYDNNKLLRYVVKNKRSTTRKSYEVPVGRLLLIDFALSIRQCVTNYI